MNALGGTRGERNAKPKFAALDINKLYSTSRGESLEPSTQKSAAPRKHGMQSLGKVPSARRPPANLPSLKAEISSPSDPQGTWANESGDNQNNNQQQSNNSSNNNSSITAAVTPGGGGSTNNNSNSIASSSHHHHQHHQQQQQQQHQSQHLHHHHQQQHHPHSNASSSSQWSSVTYALVKLIAATDENVARYKQTMKQQRTVFKLKKRQLDDCDRPEMEQLF
ncbi:homeobox protein abdominal-A-like [Culex quinquefasciatus]|uniref:homeobox protein abdominal-A-like n=1 Tax=Culex quinquefasciatus TaxID=7176 RepID=UPI0018E37788|nr:homeobox protein abdominal-A-like [Culex quinquefasciatus]